jgi:hypothetical protein
MARFRAAGLLNHLYSLKLLMQLTKEGSRIILILLEFDEVLNLILSLNISLSNQDRKVSINP